MLKEKDVPFGSIVVLIAAFALSLFYAALMMAPESGRPPPSEHSLDRFQVDPLTHPPWSWR